MSSDSACSSGERNVTSMPAARNAAASSSRRSAAGRFAGTPDRALKTTATRICHCSEIGRRDWCGSATAASGVAGGAGGAVVGGLVRVLDVKAGDAVADLVDGVGELAHGDRAAVVEHGRLAAGEVD